MATTHQHGDVAAEVLDPVCRMTISPTDALWHLDHNGRTYYFFRNECLERFLQTPDALLRRVRLPPSSAVPGATYICPLDPEIRQPQPGVCPKCGMALEPDLTTVP